MSTSITMVLGYIGCLVVFYLLGLLSRKKNANNTYDERQEIVRGRAYKYGFFALLAGQTMEVILDITETIVISREQFVLFSYLIFMVGIGVFAVYAIWNDAYLTGNDSKRSSIILFTSIGLVNVIIGISNYFNSHGDKFVYTVNFFVAGLLLICVATFIAKDIFKKDEED